MALARNEVRFTIGPIVGSGMLDFHSHPKDSMINHKIATSLEPVHSVFQGDRSVTAYQWYSSQYMV
jgi:hypothetical protein